ncbi:major facilitator superfamily domain-containing protein 3 isoform X9 [Vicugna pacos]|uniref:Major facilitator superfamily domain-containing protein 3 isoform X9 n=1 Tax=Vicugna pacos TaxID=30538 RepID=A0ABM5CBX8_VICPA
MVWVQRVWGRDPITLGGTCVDRGFGRFRRSSLGDPGTAADLGHPRDSPPAPRPATGGARGRPALWPARALYGRRVSRLRGLGPSGARSTAAERPAALWSSWLPPTGWLLPWPGLRQPCNSYPHLSTQSCPDMPCTFGRTCWPCLGPCGRWALCSPTSWVSRVPAACSPSSCWTAAFPPPSWGCGMVWVLWYAPLLAHPWAGSYWPSTGEPSSTHHTPAPLWAFPAPLSFPISSPQAATAPAEVSVSVLSRRPGLPDCPALSPGCSCGPAGYPHSIKRGSLAEPVSPALPGGFGHNHHLHPDDALQSAGTQCPAGHALQSPGHAGAAGEAAGGLTGWSPG